MASALYIKCHNRLDRINYLYGTFELDTEHNIYFRAARALRLAIIRIAEPSEFDADEVTKLFLSVAQNDPSIDIEILHKFYWMLMPLGETEQLAANDNSPHQGGSNVVV